MDLRDWRKSKDLTLEEAAALFGKMPVSTLSDLERGVPDKIYHATLVTIESVTGGDVSFADLHRSWRIENPELAISTKAAGLNAWRDHRRVKKNVSHETKPRAASRSKRKATRQPAGKRRAHVKKG